jgi:hypothetical protein
MPRPRRRLPPKPPPHKFDPLVLPDNCSEPWVLGWFEFGYRDLVQYLHRHYRFADYLDAHPGDDPALDRGWIPQASRMTNHELLWGIFICLLALLLILIVRR